MTINDVTISPNWVLVTRTTTPSGIIIPPEVLIAKVVRSGVNSVYYKDCIIGYEKDVKGVQQFVFGNVTYFLLPADKVIFSIAPSALS